MRVRAAVENTFQAPDGSELFYRAWLPLNGRASKTVLLFHRGHEHSGRFQDLVDRLQMPDVAFFAWDCRGCGKSPGPRGDALHLGQLESDMEAFYRHVIAEYKVEEEKAVVLAHSVAAVVAGLWVLDYGPRIAGLILGTPALKVKLYVPLAREGLTALSSVGVMTDVQSYVRGSALTHDKEQAQSYDADPLISKNIATRVLLDLYKGAERLLVQAEDIVVPTQVLVARADWVIKNGPIQTLHQRLSGPKEIKVYQDFFHAIFHEKDRHLVDSDIRRFMQECWSRGTALPVNLGAPSRARYEWLKAGPPRISTANVFWKISRLSMSTAGRLSKGMRIGYKSGFSSGQMLDYVYQNRPRGWTPFGKLIDYFYLNSIGWVCIRQRRKHLQSLLREALESTQAKKVADIAGGPARYMLDVLQEYADPELRAVIRDRDENGLEEGRQLAAQQGESRITYQSGDAFDRSDVASLGPLDVAVVSGLYELFPDNGPVARSLAGLAQAVKPGGYLLYTNQPYHPTLELIAETLHHAGGTRWVMRCRSTAEMDTLVREAGFEKCRSLIDRHGIFSVSMARRLPE